MIYASIPVARELREWVSEHLGRHAFLVAVLAVGIEAGIVAAVRVVRIRARRLPWLLGVGAAFAAWTWSLREAPEEAVHFVEYGVLGVLLYRAMAVRISDPLVYPCALGVGALVGFGDELIQWLHPRRLYGLRDVRLDLVAVGLAQVAIWGAFRPEATRGPIRLSSVRTAVRLALVLTVILAAVLSGTAENLRRVATVVPAFHPQRQNEGALAEYGYRHTFEGGTFRSRLPLDRLHQEDATRAPQVARLVDDAVDREAYLAFIKTWSPGRDPFVHELRVHLFRRDRYRERMGGAEDPAERMRLASVAWGEQRLLEAHFAHSLAASSYTWSEAERREVRAAADTSAPYHSPVSERLITWFSVVHVWWVAGLLLAGLVGWERWLPRRIRRREDPSANGG